MSLVNSLPWLIETIRGNLVAVARYPFSPQEHLYLPYVITSFVCALIVWRRRAGRSPRSESLVEFLFPRRVWRSSSAWLDVRYFVFHQVVRVSIYGGYAALVTGLTHRVLSASLGAVGDAAATPRPGGWIVGLGYALFTAMLLDLVAYA